MKLGRISRITCVAAIVTFTSLALGDATNCFAANRAVVDDLDKVAFVRRHRDSIVELDFGGVPVPTDNRVEVDLEKLRVNEMADLKTLNLGGTSITDADLRFLETLTNLESLDLQYTRISDSGMSSLASLSKLRALNLSGTRVSPRGLRLLADLGLRRLILKGAGDVSQLRFLQAFEDLEHIDLTHTPASYAPIGPSLQRLSRLKTLVISRNAVTDAQLSSLARVGKLLTLQPDTHFGIEALPPTLPRPALDLRETRVTASGLRVLTKAKALRSLNLSNTSVRTLAELPPLPNLEVLQAKNAGLNGDGGIFQLRWCRKLRVLNLNDNEWLSDSCFKHVMLAIDHDGGVFFPNLRSLSLQSTRIGDKGLAFLENLRSLETLDLKRSTFTDASMKSIRKIRGLRRLELGPAFTDAALKSLRDFPKLEHLALTHNASESGVEDISKTPTLISLAITSWRPTPPAIAALRKIEGLKILHLRAATLPNGAEASFSKLRHLKSLRLEGMDLPSSLFDHFDRNSDLRQLILQHCQFEEAGIRNPQRLSQLESVHLEAISADAVLNAFTAFPRLESIAVLTPNLSRETLTNMTELSNVKRMVVYIPEGLPENLWIDNLSTMSQLNSLTIAASSRQEMRPVAIKRLAQRLAKTKVAGAARHSLRLHPNVHGFDLLGY